MGLGAYLASVTEKHHYDAEERRERQEVLEKPAAEEEEIFDIFDQYGVSRDASRHVVEALKVNEDMWVQVSGLARLKDNSSDDSAVHDGL